MLERLQLGRRGLPKDTYEFYISELIGKKIFDNYGHRVGKVRDLVAVWDSGNPRVTGIKITHSTEILPIEQVVEFCQEGVFLHERPRLSLVRPIRDEEIFVNRWLLDKQVVDTKGAKVVRVNDIRLLWQTGSDQQIQVSLTAVDIGLRGLIRRLGLQGLCNLFNESLLEWQNFKPLETRTAHLTLAISPEELAHLHPADIADILEDLDRNDQEALLRNLDSEKAAEILAEVNAGVRSRLLENMDSEELSVIIQEMGPDEAADVLGDLPEEKSEEILDLMEPEDAEEIRELMEYPDDTAGSLMTTEMVTMPGFLTAQQAIDYLRELAPSAEIIYYVYLVDEHDHLLGVLSLRELIVAKADTPIGELVNPNVITLDPYDDYDEVLEISIKYDFLALPVVNAEKELLGVVTFDDVMGEFFAERASRWNAEKYSHLMFRRNMGRKHGERRD